MPLLKGLLRKLFDIRRGEALRASLMFLYIFLIISSLMIVKPVANSLFLSKFGASHLPYAFMLVAICAGGVTTFYLRLMKHGRLKKLITRTLQFFVICLFAFWLLLHFKYLESWALYVFYVWVAIFAVISTSQFWTLANIIFNAREAKRLFGFLGAGAIAGGIAGGYLTNFLAPVVGSKDLLFVCMASLAGCIPITGIVWKKAAADAGETFRTQKQMERLIDHPLKLLKESKHVAYLAVIVGISVVVAKLVDFQYSAIASESIPNHDELTAFFGFWLSNFNIASLLIQLFLTRKVVGVFGVGTSLYFLPLGILIGAVATLTNPAIWSAILIKINDGSLKQSINKAGLELLTLPIPPDIKKQAKAFLDVFVDSFATGIGGFILIGLTLGLQFSASYVSLVIIPFIGLWLFMVRRVRREYIQSFRQKIESSRAPSLRALDALKRESVYGGLISVLKGGNERKILHVLRMIKDVQNDRFVPYLMELLHHPSSAIRLEVLRNIYFYKHLSFKHDVKELVKDSDQQVKTEALHYLFQHAKDDGIALLRTYLKHPDYGIRGAALLCAARESKDNQKLKQTFNLRDLVEERLRQLEELDDKQLLHFTKINCAEVIGAANIPELYPHLHELLKDRGTDVIKAAIISAGQTGNREFIPILFQYLEDNQLQSFATQALASFGPEIVELLVYFMNSAKEDPKIRLRIPRVIASFGEQRSVDALLNNAGHRDLNIRREVLKALNRMRETNGDLRFDQSKIEKRILQESKTYRTLFLALFSQVEADHQLDEQIAAVPNLVQIKLARQNLIEALEKRLEESFERLFLLLALRYQLEAIHDVYLSLRSHRRDQRANAIEFLDNVLEGHLKKIIIPIVETTLVESLVEETLRRLGFRRYSEVECLGWILTGEDNDLKEVTLKLISQLGEDRFDHYIFKLLKDPDPKIKKMARWALQMIGFLERGVPSQPKSEAV